MKQIRRMATILAGVACLCGLLATVLLPGAALSAQADVGTPASTVGSNILSDEPRDSNRFVPLEIEDYFSCDVPKGWSQGDHSVWISKYEKIIYGVTLNGPWRGEIPVRMTMVYHEGNLPYASIDHYLRSFSEPALGVVLEGESCGPITSRTVSGRDAKVFERLEKQFMPLNLDGPATDDGKVYESKEMMARPVPVRERFVAVPAESGFYELSYSASTEDFEEFFPDFERVILTFKALR